MSEVNHEILVPSEYTILERIPGIVNTRGKSAGKEQNWAYLVKNIDGNKCVLMYCAPGIFTILDENVIDAIRIINNKQISWFKLQCGYIGCHAEINETKTNIYLHQVLLNHLRNGKGQSSVDHINRNKLDNRLSNLRIVSQSEQNENRDKVRRHVNAKELPNEIKNETLPKFVVYYKEHIKDNFREFFTVEGHPLQRLKQADKLNKAVQQLQSHRWATTKSNKISISDKLIMAKKYIEELDKLQKNHTYVINIPNKNAAVMSLNKTVLEQQSDNELSHTISPIDDIKDNVAVKEETSKLKQWKVKQIYEAISENRENTYKEYCEKNNDMTSIDDWPMQWATFILSVKGKTFVESEAIIRQFVQNLRTQRHNKLCYNKNASLVDRTDRQQWPATTIVRAFLDNKIDVFKGYTEAQTGDDPENPIWQKRWNSFVASLENNKDNQEELQKLCSKFLTAQRAKRYRHK